MGGKDKVKIALISLFGLDFGLRYISSFLKKNGYPAYIVFFNKKRYSIDFLGNDYFNAHLVNHHICYKKDLDLLMCLLKKLDVKVVGISLTSTTFQTAKAITLEIKKYLDVLVVWGGIHAVISPEECIQYADIVCIGEGEIPMLELADKLSRNEPVDKIKNLWIKNKNGVEKNEMSTLIDRLDILPFPDFIDMDNKFLIDGGRIGREYVINSSVQRSMYPIMTSRGCLYSCSFCCNSVLRQRYEGKGHYLRRRSVDNVIAELRNAVENRQFSRIRFWDDVFTFDAQWIEEFCARYIREIGKPFVCYTHPRCTNRDILIKLRRAGLETANVGIQSGSERISRQLFSRAQINQDFLNFASFIKKIGITARYDLILDNPYETSQDQEATVELLMQLPYPFQIQLYSLCWFPETPLTKKALNDGTISLKDLEQYTSKALNNFHMYIPLSKTKKDFFWNCIKAMAVNRLFPNFLIKFCSRNEFFRKYPKVLFLLAKNYLYLFSRFNLKWEKNRIAIIKKVPINVTPAVVYRDRDIISNDFIFDRADWLFRNPMINWSFFLYPNSDDCKELRLRIRNGLRREITVSLVFSLVHFDELSDELAQKSIWLIKLPIGYSHDTDVHFKLFYPELKCYSDGFEYDVKLLKAEIPSLIKKELYLAALSNITLPYISTETVILEA